MDYYLAVYVPHTSHPEVGHIDRGSGVIGIPHEDGGISIYYEGNRYGAANLRTFADRVGHAASRLRFDAPTVAKAVVPADALEEVGRYDGVEGRIELTGERAERALCHWLGVAQLDPAELRRTEVVPRT